MGRPLGCDPGGIQGLLSLPREQCEALEADLSDRGLHGGFADIPDKMSWRVLKSVIKYSPRTSALVREVFGEQVEWSITDHVLAGVLDYSALIAWLLSDTKRNKRPEPIQRPGQEKQSKDKSLGTAVAVKDFQRLWDENIARATQSTDGGDQDAGGSGAGHPELDG